MAPMKATSPSPYAALSPFRNSWPTRASGTAMAGKTVRQIHDEEMHFLLDAADDDHSLTEICLFMTRRMRQWHEHRAPPSGRFLLRR
ncbi:hypothetical protein RNZ50_06740 [Paracoccaceae bacterium Fryx2]|nr:hypothetical protein [Paracoccaceae bacterium Fryx2]